MKSETLNLNVLETLNNTPETLVTNRKHVRSTANQIKDNLKKIIKSSNIEKVLVLLPEEQNEVFQNCLKGFNQRDIQYKPIKGDKPILQLTTIRQNYQPLEECIPHDGAILFKNIIFQDTDLLAIPLNKLLPGYKLVFAKINPIDVEINEPNNEHTRTSNCLRGEAEMMALEPGFILANDVIDCSPNNSTQLQDLDPLILDIGKDGFLTTQETGFQVMDKCIFEQVTKVSLFVISKNTDIQTQHMVSKLAQNATIIPFKYHSVCGNPKIISIFSAWAKKVQQDYNLTQESADYIRYKGIQEFLGLPGILEQDSDNLSNWDKFWTDHTGSIISSVISNIITSIITTIVTCCCIRHKYILRQKNSDKATQDETLLLLLNKHVKTSNKQLETIQEESTPKDPELNVNLGSVLYPLGYKTPIQTIEAKVEIAGGNIASTICSPEFSMIESTV